MIRLRKIALMSAADLMACFIGVLFLMLVVEKEKLEAKREQVEQDVKEMEQKINDAEIRLDQLRQSQWEVVTQKFVWQERKQRVPDLTLYALREGIYYDPTAEALSDEAIQIWFAKVATKNGPDVVFVIENGANDEYTRLRDLSIRAGIEEYSLTILPSEARP